MRSSILVFLLFCLACSKKEAPGPTGSAAAATEPAAKAVQESPPPEVPPSVELVEPGEEPRNNLRWQVAPGSQQKLSMTLEAEIEALFQGVLRGGVTRPTITYELNLEAGNNPSGEDASVRFSVQSVDLPDLSETTEAQRVHWRKAASVLREATGTYALDPRGWVHDVKVTLPSYTSPQARQMAEDLRWSLAQLGTPVPEKPVGLGAKWKTTLPLEQNGARVNQVATVELVSIEGGRIQVEMAIEQSAEPQEYRQPGGYGDVLELVELTTTGSGEASWDLAEPAPRSLQVETSEQTQAVNRKVDAVVAADIATKRKLTVQGE